MLLVVINSVEGVGPRIVTALAKEGVEVIGTYTAREEEAESLKKAVEQINGSVKFVSGDMKAPKDIERLETILKESSEGKRVTVVINGTGASGLVDKLVPYITTNKGGKIVFVGERSWFGT